MTTFTNQTKNTSSYGNQAKNATSYTNGSLSNYATWDDTGVFWDDSLISWAAIGGERWTNTTKN